jgi:hypothetical protein
MALLVVLLGLFSGLAIAGRALNSKEKENESSQSLSARDAAEIGMARIISELNRSRNRRLLLNAPMLDVYSYDPSLSNQNGNTGTILPATIAGIQGNNDLKNPCNSLGESIDLNGVTNSNPSAAGATVLQNEVQIPNTSGNLRYVLMGVRNGLGMVGQDYSKVEYGPAGPVSVWGSSGMEVGVGDAGDPGRVAKSSTIRLDVQGLLYQNGVVVARYNLRKTFEVIPRCCGSGYGGYVVGTDGGGGTYVPSLWGTDPTECGVSSGYGLVIGNRLDPASPTTWGSLETYDKNTITTLIGTPLDEKGRLYCNVPSTGGPYGNSNCPFTLGYTYTDPSGTLTPYLNWVTVPNTANWLPLPVASSTRSVEATYVRPNNVGTLSVRTGNYTGGTLRSLLAPVAPEPTNVRLMDAYPTAFLNTSTCTVSLTSTQTTTSSLCEVPEYARMRICDRAADINSVWPGADARATSLAVLSTTPSDVRVGCRIRVTASETLNTRNFETWRQQPTNTLQWHLARLCTRVWDWGGGGGTTRYVANRQMIYCNLDELNLDSGVTLTFDTTSASPLPTLSSQPLITSVPIILAFPNGSLDVDPIKTVLGPSPTNTTSASIIQINSRRNPPQPSDLSIFGCRRLSVVQSAACQNQRIGSSSGNTITLQDVLVFAPYGTMSSNDGTLIFQGVYWGNRLSMPNSSSKFKVSPGWVSKTSGFSGWSPTQSYVEQEYIARNLLSVSSFCTKTVSGIERPWC